MNVSFETLNDAPEALSMLFTRNSVPPAIIVDGAKEFLSIDYKKRVRAAGCDFRQLEPRSPWQNTAEGSIRELKKETGRAMIATGTPKRPWDDCPEYRASIRSNTALNIYELYGQVPETIMTGQTANIGPWCDFQWSNGTNGSNSMMRLAFLDDKQILGKYLGPSLGVGSLMTAKILKANGEYWHGSTFRALTQEEEQSPLKEDKRKAFLQSIEVKLGPKSKVKDFDDDLNLHNSGALGMATVRKWRPSPSTFVPRCTTSDQTGVFQ